MKVLDQHHVMRHIPYKKLWKDDEGEVIDSRGIPYGALPQAFQLRDIDQNKLSVNWLEYFGKSSYEENLIATVQSVRHNPNRPISRESICGFAFGQVLNIKRVGERFGFDRIKVVHTPSKDKTNESHSSIKGLFENNLDLMAALADEAFADVRLNQHIPYA